MAAEIFLGWKIEFLRLQGWYCSETWQKSGAFGDLCQIFEKQSKVKTWALTQREKYHVQHVYRQLEVMNWIMEDVAECEFYSPN